MKGRLLTLALLLPAAALLIWRVEWDSAFLPARLQQDMTERSRAPRPHVAGAIPFESNKQAAPADLLYRQHCAACHGANGTTPPYLANYPGMPQITSLYPPPPDTSTWADSISRGRGAMPAYASLLTPEQIQSLIAHIPTLGQTARNDQAPLSHPQATEQARASQSALVAIHFAWERALVSFLLSLPLGMVFLRSIMPRKKEAQLPGAFEKSLALTLGSAAASALAGLILWGSSAFVLPSLAFAGGLACHALSRRGHVESCYPALQTTALAVAAYALTIPHLVGNYLPGSSLPWYLTALHAVCLGALLVLILLLPIHSLRSARGLFLHAVAVLLVLAYAHALLGCCI